MASVLDGRAFGRSKLTPLQVPLPPWKAALPDTAFAPSPLLSLTSSILRLMPIESTESCACGHLPYGKLLRLRDTALASINKNATSRPYPLQFYTSERREGSNARFKAAN
jgi:hypothetical protein